MADSKRPDDPLSQSEAVSVQSAAIFAKLPVFSFENPIENFAFSKKSDFTIVATTSKVFKYSPEKKVISYAKIESSLAKFLHISDDDSKVFLFQSHRMIIFSTEDLSVLKVADSVNFFHFGVVLDHIDRVITDRGIWGLPGCEFESTLWEQGRDTVLCGCRGPEPFIFYAGGFNKFFEVDVQKAQVLRRVTFSEKDEEIPIFSMVFLARSGTVVFGCAKNVRVFDPKSQTFTRKFETGSYRIRYLLALKDESSIVCDTFEAIELIALEKGKRKVLANLSQKNGDFSTKVEEISPGKLAYPVIDRLEFVEVEKGSS